MATNIVDGSVLDTDMTNICNSIRAKGGASGTIAYAPGDTTAICGAIANIPSGGGGGSHTYSTTEQLVGEWIDGSPVYEISISSNTAIDMYVFTTVADLSSYNVDKIVSIDVSVTVNEDGDSIYRTYARGQYFIALFRHSDSLLQLKQSITSRGGLNWSTVATIRYTKTAS